MAGHGNEPELKGLLKHFNSTTDYGRANFAKATYAAVALISLYFYMKPKKAPAPAPAPTGTK